MGVTRCPLGYISRGGWWWLPCRHMHQGQREKQETWSSRMSWGSWRFLLFGLLVGQCPLGYISSCGRWRNRIFLRASWKFSFHFWREISSHWGINLDIWCPCGEFERVWLLSDVHWRVVLGAILNDSRGLRSSSMLERCPFFWRLAWEAWGILFVWVRGGAH